MLSAMPPDPKRYSTKKGSRAGETRVCAADGCSNEFYVKPYMVGRTTGRFCSRACFAASRPKQSEDHRRRKSAMMKRRNRIGSANPNYRHGRRVGEHIRGWSCKAKGEDRCRVCGSKSYLSLHHAIPRGIGTRESRVNLLNGIPLCGSHHTAWHRGVREIRRSHFTAEEWNYLESVELTGRVTSAWLADAYPV